MEWHIEHRSLCDLHEWARNPRIMSEKGIKDLTKSIQKFGCAEPIIINLDGTICGGHGRKKVLENLGDYDSSKSFKAWYSRILVNTSIDNYRRNLKHSSSVSIDNIDMEEQEPEIDIELSVNDILKIFSQIPEQYKVTFNLFEIEGYSHEEIGKLLGVTTSTSRSNLARAKKMVREIYMKEFKSAAKRHEAV